jgi:acylglycerol lipase
MSVEEGIHTLPDGTQLYTKTWKVSLWSVSNRGRGSANNNTQPEGTPRAVLAFVHGFSDHCELPIAYKEMKNHL